MDKILSPDQAIQLATGLNKKDKRIVLVGGCFDILHIGHITFLEEAKKQGDVLFVLLESDETIKKLKGPNRPFNIQHDRAIILSSLSMIDYVIKLSPITDNKEYDNLVIQIKPAIIATTAGDSTRIHKERQAKLLDAKVIDVTTPVSNRSTSRLVDFLKEL